jgi:hypothetical protein
MSRFDYDFQEKVDFHSPTLLSCANCQTTNGPIDSVPVDGKWTLLCEACAEENARQEALADQLAAAPSCPERQRIIDSAETVGGLVNALRAHDQADCTVCAAVEIRRAA